MGWAGLVQGLSPFGLMLPTLLQLHVPQSTGQMQMNTPRIDSTSILDINATSIPTYLHTYIQHNHHVPSTILVTRR